LDKRVEGGATAVTLQVEYLGGTPQASLMDLYLRASAPLAVSSVTEAAKDGGSISLLGNPVNGEWSVGPRALRLVARPEAATLALGPIATLRLRVHSEQAIRLWIERRAGVLAPSEADGALQGCGYDEPLWVRP
jgi:hypothetical protein